MAVPFRRTSKTKKRMRRTHLKKTAANVVTCPNCGEPIRPHRACMKCGYYKGKEVVKPQYTMENNSLIEFIDEWHLGEDLNLNYYTK